MKQYRNIIVAVLLGLVLAACQDQSIQEDIYNHLETAVQLEQDFAKQQDIINDLEIQEQQIYNKIISLSTNEKDEINELSAQALQIIEERKIQIDKEKASIEASKEEFIKIEPLIDQLDDQAIVKKAKAMFDIMSNRYVIYDQLYLAYRESLELEKKLYELLADEHGTQEQLTNLIDEINQQYDNIITRNEVFNAETVKYNDSKKEFYNMTELKIEY